ncbi:MAG: beta-ketoacyl synthase N-terminal-like domain-containing protein [Candidatus Thiodiazotropha sp.]
MTSNRLPIIGMACASHLGENLRGLPASDDPHSEYTPPYITLASTGLVLPYYAIDENLDSENRLPKILFEVVGRALDRSELTSEDLRHTGIFIGSSSYDLRHSEVLYQKQLAAADPNAMPMAYTGYNRLGAAVCEHFSIGGEPFNLNTACTSSANALLLAHSMLRQEKYRHALVIGLELYNETTITGFSGLQLIAEQRIAPFDAERDGILLGESCSAVVLSADHRRTTGTGLYTHGGGSSFDPYSITTSNPDGSTIARALELALHHSGIDRQQILAIKTHGTGTRMNDASESQGIINVFGPEIPPITAIKPYVGHTLGACGTLELILFGQALRDGWLPKTLNLKTPDPDLDLTPMRENREAQAGFYLLDFFGFGGSNTVIVLEKA